MVSDDHFMPKIVVIGVGGAGLNAVNNMILSKLEGVKFIVANTDRQSLSYSLAENKIQLGELCTRGLGAGAKPEVGKQAAEESADLIREAIQDADMVFVAGGMGGGTCTGAAAVIGKIAKENALVVAIVTTPFEFEGSRRMMIATGGIAQLEKTVDTLIVVSNENLRKLATKKTSLAKCFKMADDVLYNAVKCITELLTKPGFINRDFADLKTVLESGSVSRAMIGYGEGTGDDRHINAVNSAITNPLLEIFSIERAKGVLINVTGGSDMSLFEVENIVDSVRSKINEDANIIFGTVLDEEKTGTISVSIVAAGMENVDINRNELIENRLTEKRLIENNINNNSTIDPIERNINNGYQRNIKEEVSDFDVLKDLDFNLKDSFLEDEINNTEDFSTITPSQDELHNMALNDVTNVVEFQDNTKQAVEKKKKSFFGSSNMSMPLFTKTYDTLCAFGKGIMDDRNQIMTNEANTGRNISISQLKEEFEIKEKEEENDIWTKPAITRTA